MNKLLSTFFVCLMIATVAVMPVRAQAQDGSGLPPKAKAFLMVTAYGAGGGALLGLASMAFGTSTRAVAQGASLGLYAGIIFGGYILLSHHNRTAKPSYDSRTPYKDDVDDYSDYGEEKTQEGGGGFFDSSIHMPRSGAQVAMNEVNSYRSFETKKGSSQLPPLQMTFFRYSF